MAEENKEEKEAAAKPEETIEEEKKEEEKGEAKYIDVFSDEEVEVEESRSEDVGSTLLRTYHVEAAEALDELVRKIVESLDSPIVVDGNIVLCRQPHLVDVQGSGGDRSGPSAYAIRGVDGLWIDTGFVAYNAYEAYRHASVHVAKGTKAAIVLRGNTYTVLVRNKLPARFAYASREALVL